MSHDMSWGDFFEVIAPTEKPTTPDPLLHIPVPPSLISVPSVKPDYFEDFMNGLAGKTHSDWEDMAEEISAPHPGQIAEALAVEQYTKFLPEYRFSSSQKNMDNFKCIDLETREKISNNPDIGWKIHLNVSPENSQDVSSWLKKHDMEHKFISGGEVLDGKVFTVYLGSHTNAAEKIPIISDEIGDYLEENPKVLETNTDFPNGEARFAPKIYGRFVAGKRFGTSQYGAEGVSLIDGDLLQIRYGGITKENAVNKATSFYTKKFGEYFGGMLPYYPGKK